MGSHIIVPGGGGAVGRVLSLLSSPQQIPSDGATYAFGPFYFDPTWVSPSQHLRLATEARVDDIAQTGSVRLWDTVANESVSAILAFTGSLDYLHLTDSLTIGAAPGNVKLTARLYEIRVTMTGVGKFLFLANSYLEIY
jgi:hypothetical protein